MTQPDFNLKELRTACDAVRRASQLAHAIQQKMVCGSLTKSDSSPVTVADFAGQAVVAQWLADRFPEDPLVGEESSGLLRSAEGEKASEEVTDFIRQIEPKADKDQVLRWVDRGAGHPDPKRFWTLDPVDGTKGFIRGDQYAVALALIVNGRVEVGVLGCPHLDLSGRPEKESGSLFFAVRGQGAWSVPMEGPGKAQRLQVSDCRKPEELRLLRSYVSARPRMALTEHLTRTFGSDIPPLPMDSQAKYAVVAAGGAEGFFYPVPHDRPDYRMKIWDVAPGAIVVEEAGGRTSDFQGKPLDYSQGRTLARNPGIVVTNGGLHDPILDFLRRNHQEISDAPSA